MLLSAQAKITLDSYSDVILDMAKKSPVVQKSLCAYHREVGVQEDPPFFINGNIYFPISTLYLN